MKLNLFALIKEYTIKITVILKSNWTKVAEVN